MGGRLLSLALQLAVVWAVLALVPAAHESFESAKALGMRAIGAASLAFIIACGRWRSATVHPIDAAMALWLAVECIATAGSVSPGLSVLGGLDAHDGLLTSFGLAGIYAAARFSAREQQHAEALLQTLQIACAWACVYALAQAMGWDPLRWDDRFAYPAGAGFVRRVFGPLGNPTMLALVAAVATVLGLERCSAVARTPWWHWLAPLLGATALVCTLSRGGWLATAAGLIALGVFTRHRATKLRRLAVPALVTAACAAATLAMLWSRWGSAVLARGQELVGGPSRSAFERTEIWSALARGWSSRPISGFGPDMVGLMFQQFQQPGYWGMGWAELPTHGHSAVMHVLFTRGLLGILALAVLSVALIRTLLSLRASGDVAFARMRAPAVMLVIVSTAGALNMLGVAGATLTVVSLALLACAEARSAAPRRTGREPRIPFAIAAVVLLVMVGIGVVEMRGLRALWRAEKAYEQASALAGDRGDAIFRVCELEARRATDLLPWNDDPWRRVAEALLEQGGGPSAVCDQTTHAVFAARRAVRLQPLRAVNHVCLARALAGMGACADTAAFDAAVLAVRRAVELAPANAMILTDCARTELAIGRPVDALRLADRVVELYPAVAWGYSARAAAYLRLGRPGDARRELERAMPLDWEDDLGMRAGAESMLLRLESALDTVGNVPPRRTARPEAAAE